MTKVWRGRGREHEREKKINPHFVMQKERQQGAIRSKDEQIESLEKTIEDLQRKIKMLESDLENAEDDNEAKSK